MLAEDPRFPNRKRKIKEQSALDEKLFEIEEQDPNQSGQAPPMSGYRIIGTSQTPPDEDLVAPELPIAIEASAEPVEVIPPPTAAPAAAPTPLPGANLNPSPEAGAAAPPSLPSRPLDRLIARARKFAENPVRLYAAAGIGLGLFLGFIVLAIFLLTGPQDIRSDMGSTSSNAIGLQGHLYLEWNKHLLYRVSLEPSDPEVKAGFALAVASSPRPLSIGIQLNDNQGFALCSKNILLKYDARSAIPLDAPLPDSAPENAAGSTPAVAPPAVDFAKLDAQEAAREHGNDLFQTQIGPDGQAASLSAQGQIPCSKKAFEDAASWVLVPNFPSLAEQDALLKRKKELQELATHPAPVVHQKAFPVKLLAFATEGDDAIVDLDLYHGVIETHGRKTVFFDKTNQAAADARWQDYPVSIHYRCDRTSDCVLMHSGLGALRARMRR